MHRATWLSSKGELSIGQGAPCKPHIRRGYPHHDPAFGTRELQSGRHHSFERRFRTRLNNGDTPPWIYQAATLLHGSAGWRRELGGGTLLHGYANPLKGLHTSESVNLHKCLILLDSCRIHATRCLRKTVLPLTREPPNHLAHSPSCFFVSDKESKARLRFPNKNCLAHEKYMIYLRDSKIKIQSSEEIAKRLCDLLLREEELDQAKEHFYVSILISVIG